MLDLSAAHHHTQLTSVSCGRARGRKTFGAIESRNRLKPAPIVFVVCPLFHAAPRSLRCTMLHPRGRGAKVAAATTSVAFALAGVLPAIVLSGCVVTTAATPTTAADAAATTTMTATLSNVALPRDQNGELIITGEASAMQHGGFWWFYFNDWGTCPGVDCCASSAGCASCCFDDFKNYTAGCADPNNGSDPYGLYHTIQAYRTADLTHWENMGTALRLQDRAPGIEFRPCVVYNAHTDLFIMWYEDRSTSTPNYQVATAPSAEGPYTTVPGGSGAMPGRGRIGDYNIFIDDDGTAYHVRTGFDIVRLNENYTAPETHVANFTTPRPSEGPTMFKRNGVYYITAGTGCCACVGGSSVYVLSAPAPEGPWVFQGDVGSVPGTPFDPHSAHNYVTNAQGSAVLRVGDDVVYLGNQWNTGLRETPPGPRNHDLLYWGVLGFEPPPAVVCWDEIQEHKDGRPVTLACPTAGGVVDEVVFAAFGTPSGQCSGSSPLAHNTTCDAGNVTAIVTSLCVGKPSCVVEPSADVFGDPCVGTVKYFAAALHCKGGADRVQQMVWHDTVDVSF